jgi:nitrogen-specific signal transduction histidine kinase/CheY-like chemotaxis protein
VGCTWDVTERVRTEEHRQRAQRLASVGTLAGGMAHDLNNALAPIAMGLDLLVRHGRPDARASETIATMVESVRRAAAIVAQLVTFTRGGDGRAVATPVQRALDELRAVLEETFPESIRIRIDAASAALPLVRIDFAQLQHVLLNLCVNARDAMPRGGSLEITCEAIDIDAARQAAAYPELKPGMHVAVHVADTGGGIAPEIRDCIFDPFFTTKPVGHGSGLGLSTALGVVRAQGGAIRFESREGAGTRFTVLLPAADAGDKPIPPAGEMAGASEVTPPRSLRGSTVLVVDDEPAVREVVRRGLEMEGVRVLVASDGAEAVAMFARCREVIDVVLMDLLMPVMNGAMATAAIRRVRADAIVIAASGYATDAVVNEARKLGVSGFLTKPYEMAALLAALDAAIAKR